MQAYTGTVNQDIDVAKLADGLRDLRFALIGIRNVAFEGIDITRALSYLDLQLRTRLK